MELENKHHISQLFNLPDGAEFDFFDANLEHDLPVFIDPFLLKNSPNSDEKALFERFGDYFRYAYDQAALLSMRQTTIRDFSRLVTFHEPKNIYMGYTEESNDGKGAILTKRLLDFFLRSSAKKYVRETKYFPDHLYNPVSLQVFTDGIGPDGISDITANLIMDYLVAYTQQQAKMWKIELKEQLALNQDGFDFEEMQWRNGGYYSLPENPLKPGEPIIFVPRRLLRGFEEFSEKPISRVVSILKADPELSVRFSGILEKTIKEISIDEIRDIFITEGSIHFKYLENLESERDKPYDFDTDFLGLLADKDYSDFFSDKQIGSVESCSDLKAKVEELIDEFNKEFSQRDGWKDAWKPNSSGTLMPQTEPVIGRRFRGMGYAYFKQLPDVTFIPEAGTGNGLVDFHIVYKNCRALVELKLLCNSSTKGTPPIKAYLHGIERQLPQYVSNANAKFAYYLTGQHYVSNNEGKPDHSSRLVEINNARPAVEAMLKNSVPNFESLNVINVDMSQKPSASKI